MHVCYWVCLCSSLSVRSRKEVAGAGSEAETVLFTFPVSSHMYKTSTSAPFQIIQAAAGCCLFVRSLSPDKTKGYRKTDVKGLTRKFAFRQKHQTEWRDNIGLILLCYVRVKAASSDNCLITVLSRTGTHLSISISVANWCACSKLM